MSAVAQNHAPTPPSAALRSFEAQWQARAADALQTWREQAVQRLVRLGLPSAQDESWRYTNLRGLTAHSFAAAPLVAKTAATLAAPAASPDTPSSLAAHIEIVNGYPQLPGAAATRIAGLEISSLAELAQRDPARVAAHLSHSSDQDHQRWGLLNTALCADGLYIRVKATLPAPLLLLHRATGTAENCAYHPLVVIDVEPGCAATIIEQHAGGPAPGLLCNSATHVQLRDNAQLEHYRIFMAPASMTQLDTLNIRQQRTSRCKQFTVALGGGVLRTNLDAQLLQADAMLDSHALLVGHANRHVDCLNIAEHVAPHTRSRQTARAIASGKSRVVFNSKVIVGRDAAHSDSQQSSRGLLLSPTAEIDTRPQLEIHTDDVKCAHGATTGRLDPNMLFYMLSRGIERETAQSLLVYAFLADVLTGMSVETTRTAIETALIAQLPDSQVLQAFR
jgi:Fe-S cluster assembly protein SufD